IVSTFSSASRHPRRRKQSPYMNILQDDSERSIPPLRNALVGHLLFLLHGSRRRQARQSFRRSVQLCGISLPEIVILVTVRIMEIFSTSSTLVKRRICFFWPVDRSANQPSLM